MLQNSDDWLLWRASGLGSSDAPIIMGVSPYSTPLELYEEKLGLREPKKNTFITDIGHDWEIKARARFELEHMVEVEPLCVEHETHPWLRASLDACSLEDEIFVEFKYMGEKNVQLVRETSAPLKHHFPQIQHQFMVTGFSKSYYSVYSLDKEFREMTDSLTIEVKPDEDYIAKELYPKLKEFWNRICDKNPPEPTKKDLRRMASAGRNKK